MTSVGKSQACNKCHCLKIQCSLVPSGARWGPKWKVELDVEEVAQPKRLNSVVEVLGLSVGMWVEPMTWEVLLEHSEFLADIQEVFAKQLEETKRIQKAVSATRIMVDELMEWMAWMLLFTVQMHIQ